MFPERLNLMERKKKDLGIKRKSGRMGMNGSFRPQSLEFEEMASSPIHLLELNT